jgi:hypothetical protein
MDVPAAAPEAACADPEWSDRITDPPEVRGRRDLTYDDLTIRVQVWVESSAKRQFQRHLRERLKEGLDQAGVPHPKSGYDIWMRKEAAA